LTSIVVFWRRLLALVAVTVLSCRWGSGIRPFRLALGQLQAAEAGATFGAGDIVLFHLALLPQPQSQLSGWAGVVLDEVPEVLGDRFARNVASLLNLVGDLP
jgi:hypothetical protein